MVGKERDEGALVTQGPQDASCPFQCFDLSWPIFDPFDLSQVNLDLGTIDYYSLIADLILFKDTFGRFEKIRFIFTYLQECVYNLSVSGEVFLCCYEDIVHIHKEFFCIFVHEWTKNATHCSGKGGWGIGETESHYSRDE